MIGLVFMFVKLTVWMMKIAMFALMVWLVLAMFLLLPGHKPGIRRSMYQASRTAHRGLGPAL